MSVLNNKFIISSVGNNDLIDITEKIKYIAFNCEAQNAIINIFTKSAHSSIITLDYEKGLGQDFISCIKNIIPTNYKQDNFSNDNSAYSHIRASILGRNITLSIIDKKLELSEGQRIIVVDFGALSSNIEIITSIVT